MIITIAIDCGFTKSLSETSQADSYQVSLKYAWSTGKPTFRLDINNVAYFRVETQMDCYSYSLAIASCLDKCAAHSRYYSANDCQLY